MILIPISVEVLLDTGESVMVRDVVPMCTSSFDELHEGLEEDPDAVLASICDGYSYTTAEELTNDSPSMLILSGIDGRTTALRKKCILGFTAFPPTNEEMIDALDAVSSAEEDEHDDD